jgi:hypothetical protein
MASGAVLSSEPVQSQLIELLVESLRRDAFVMEAFNYEAPALAEPEDFSRVFELLYRQTIGLFGKRTFLTAVIDAHGCRNRDTGQFERRVLTGVGHPDQICQIWQARPAPAVQQLPKLAACVETPQTILQFCSQVTPALEKFLTCHPLDTNTVPVISPYLVTSVKQSFTGLKYRQIIECWERTKKSPELLFTHSFVHGAPENIASFRDSYFSAVLLVFAPQTSRIDESRISCLEALHLSFQISWGIPALEEQKRELDQLRRESDDTRKRSESFRQLQVLAHTISRKIYEHGQQLIRELDSGTGIDVEDLAYLFVNSTRIWTGKEVSIHGLHDYPGESATVQDLNAAQAIIYYAIHRIFDKLPSNNLTISELRQSAEKLVLSPEARSNPTLTALLQRILQGDAFAFNLLKVITGRIHTVNVELPFYALATRFFLGPVDDNFSVEIAYSDRTVTLTRATFWDSSLAEDLLEKPCFSSMDAKPKEWLLPLVDLIAVQLRGLSANKDVLVPKVLMRHLKQHSEIVCPLEGSSGGVNTVREILKAQPTEEWSTRGLRGALWQLHTSRPKLSRRFAWAVDENPHSIIFKIGYSVDIG